MTKNDHEKYSHNTAVQRQEIQGYHHGDAAPGSGTREYDIIAIQEPWRNPFSDTTHHPAKDLFHLCYPAMEDGETARVCFFINKQLGHSQ